MKRKYYCYVNEIMIVYESFLCLINEVFSHSDPGEDWIELYNSTSASIDIGGWFLSDSLSDLTRFEIPADTTIAAEGYLVFFETQLGFALSSACGDEVILSAGDGTAPTGPLLGARVGTRPLAS